MSIGKLGVSGALLVAAALIVMPLEVNAIGMMSCDAGPESGWQSRDDLKTKLEGEGWEVRKVKVDEGCYEVYGTTPEGQRVEAYFDPVSFETLLIARRGEILFKKEES